MQEHIRRMIERARRSEDRITITGPQDSATSLAEEVVRMAHLATSTHMLLSAKSAASSSAPIADSTANDVQLTLHKIAQEQAS